MGTLDSGVSADGRSVKNVRVDRIGNAGERELWWVALQFDDGSTKPSGVYTDYASASKLAAQLATEWSVEIVVNRLV